MTDPQEAPSSHPASFTAPRGSPPPFLTRFAEIAQCYGDLIALREPGRQLTYAQLLLYIEQEAERLQREGGIGSLRRIERPRSIDFILDILTTWQAGAAFLPLDLSTPQKRRDGIWNEASTADLRDVAYIIYTSGSTGQPKGVRVSHRGLLPVIEAQIQAFYLAPGKRALWMLSPAFDASLSDIGTALLSGATLCIPPADLSPRSLLQFMAAENITHADLPPSLLPLLHPLPSCMEVIVIGGEVCPPEIVRSHASKLRVINVYGPTEATICTSLVECDPLTWHQPLLGTPLPHVRYQVVSDTGHEVAEGESGELWIGGISLALGYIQQPILEAARFQLIHGERWYRSGDHVRRLPGSEYEFLGRLDRQIKIHGQLVAPEEIEARIQEHPSVLETVVLPRQQSRSGHPSRTTLLAFVVPRISPEPDDLLKYLQHHLPPALCPRIIYVEALPRGTSGKIDTNALNEIFEQRSKYDSQQSTNTFVDLFSRILGIDTIVEDDNFFTLGGDSIAALELISEAEKEGIWLSADAIYLSPTPRTLVSRVSAEEQTTRALLAMLPPQSSKPTSHPPHNSHGDLLLTGATGFLGAWLLSELLEQRENSKIHLLVRAPNPQSAWQRIERALTTIGKPCPRDRIEVHPSDLEKPRYGLNESDWGALQDRVSIVIHNAARVHLLAPLQELRGPNIQACEQVLQFASHGQPKRLLYISTLSVFVATDHPAQKICEDDDPYDATFVYGGYAQSKWLAEAMVRRDGQHTILRPGLLTGATTTGRSSPTCQLTHLLRGLMDLECVPRGAHDELRVDITPVDLAAKILAKLVDAEPLTYHMASRYGATLTQLVRAIRAEGRRCDEVTPEEFYQRARASNSWSSSMALLALSRLLPQRRRAADLFQMTGREFDCTRSTYVSSLSIPDIDESLLRKYVSIAWEESQK